MTERATLWKAAAAVAVLWPSRISRPLDGIPLDPSIEAVSTGLLLLSLLVFAGGLLLAQFTRSARSVRCAPGRCR